MSLDPAIVLGALRFQQVTVSLPRIFITNEAKKARSRVPSLGPAVPSS